MSRKVKISFLETVYPPFTNREAPELINPMNPRLIELLEKSKLYMICQRPKAHIANLKLIGSILSFDIKRGTATIDSGSIDLNKQRTLDDLDNIEVNYDLDEAQHVQLGTNIGSGQFQSRIKLTPDSVYWHKSRNNYSLEGFDNHQAFAKYTLQYVGISTGQNSVDRVLSGEHKARTNIISYAPTMQPGAHPSDETVFFLFDIVPMLMEVLAPEDESCITEESYNPAKIIKDAEKAFIHMLDPSFNLQKYKSFPKSADGLYTSGYDAYQYWVSENVELITDKATLKGVRSNFGFPIPPNLPDSIYVEGDEVSINFENE
ncbi:hypothetical protein ACIP1Z_01185 [Pseudomonas moraviensis]|uniref:hypothetical protein n=1 Tax=Pseudomonas moraviensis TaxID=321662 RepID=UPI003823B916